MIMAAMRTDIGLRGRLRYNEPMAAHCSWRAGGVVARFYEPADRADLALFLQRTDRTEPLLWLGLGSNLLVRDGGFNGTVIATGRALVSARFSDATTLYAEAGIACAKLARLATQNGVAGIEFFAGIPGTLGGALAMNAGAWGGETWAVVARVETIDREGIERTRPGRDFEAGYRSVSGPPEEWFVAAELALRIDADTGVATRIRELLARRQATQPLGLPSCGSVFRNPPGDYAARLIEASGLKGLRQGGCQVSVKHANFIVNDAAGNATDIENLVELVRARVRQDHGVELVTEVRIVGVRR